MTWNSDTLSSFAGCARQSKLMSVMGWKGRRCSFTTRLEGSNLMSGERNRKFPAVERNNEKIDMPLQSRRWRMRRSSENKDHSPTFLPSVRTWGSSNDKRTNGNRSVSDSMRPCGSRKRQSFFPAVRTPFPSRSTYWAGLFDSVATLHWSLNLKEKYVTVTIDEITEIYRYSCLDHPCIKLFSIAIHWPEGLVLGHEFPKSRC